YDRFYAIMHDLAVTEHLAFAYALSGDRRFGERARDWVLASCRVWKHEADGKLDGGKAYAVCRLLKGVATGYDLAWDCFSPAERNEVEETLVRIGQMYWTDYFSTAAIAGPQFHTHHAIVEWASFGIAALALLGDRGEASAWLEATVKKFEDHLLPMGLAEDGSQIEGATFWASTMQYRLMFMDALRRAAGKDLFTDYAKFMSADLALAAIACGKKSGYSQSHETVVLEPSYGQLDYYAPVLLMMAREYRRSTCQHLALWDGSLGSLQRTRYVTPTLKEQLLFSFGGYAFVWYDPSVAAKADETRRSYCFSAVGECYLRRSWEAGDLVAAASAAQGVVLHAGGQAILIEIPSVQFPRQRLHDDGDCAVLELLAAEGPQSMTLRLARPAGKLELRRKASQVWEWWCQGTPRREGNVVSWGDRVKLTVVQGTIERWEPEGRAEALSTAFGKLPMADPASRRFPLAAIRPGDGDEIRVEVEQGSPGDKP
ncbi:MAG: DUF4962 domain-containing protein, partial [Pirellulales bacterium]|nr:DUF4962 domain-containing protein [Pirellulales bacterium]